MTKNRQLLSTLRDTIQRQNGLQQSASARLREVYDLIVQLQTGGIKHGYIVEQLNGAGLEISIITFRSSLQRIKKNIQSRTIQTEKDLVNTQASGATVQYSKLEWREVNVKADALIAIAERYGVKPSDLEGLSKNEVSEYLTGLHKRKLA